MNRTFLSLSVLAVAACGSRHHAIQGPSSIPVGSAVATAPAKNSTPARSTGPLALLSPQIAIVADEDPPSVRAFDLSAGKESWSVALDGTPGHVAISSDGRRVFVAVRAKNRIDVIDAGGGGGGSKIAEPFAKVCTEPVGVSITPDERTMLVACGWSHEVMAISMQDAHVMWRTDVALEPRAVLASADSSRALVAHAVGGKATVLDLEKRQPRSVVLAGSLASSPKGAARRGPTLPGAVMATSNGFAIAEDDGTFYVPAFAALASRSDSVASSYYGSVFDEGVVFPIVADEVTQTGYLYTRVIARSNFGTRASTSSPVVQGCLAPRGVAVRAAGATRIVACPGNDSLIEQDINDSVIRRISIPSPSAIVIAAGGEPDKAIVWSQATRSLSTVHLGDGHFDLMAAATGSPNADAMVQRGKHVFDRVEDPRITRDGRGCATCHPDGRSDALTWGTPEGPRQTMMLADRLEGTAPYGWTRNAKTLHDYVGSTVKRLGGTGLDPLDMDAVVAYLGSLRAPAFTSPTSASIIERGKVVFQSRETGCSGCHSGKRFTDGQSHDVSSASYDDRSREFDTPSLRFVGFTAPYFHDGRYPSLKSLLTSVDGTMGHTRHLSEQDKDALEAYLKSL